MISALRGRNAGASRNHLSGDPGVPALVHFGHKLLGQDRGLRPEQVEHAQLGITWHVTGILDRWQHPGRAEQTLGQATLTKCGS